MHGAEAARLREEQAHQLAELGVVPEGGYALGDVGVFGVSAAGVAAAYPYELTNGRHDLHQDHRLVCELTLKTGRDHVIIEYEV